MKQAVCCKDYYTIIYYTLYYIMVNYIILYHIVVYCIILYCIIIYYVSLLYNAGHSSPRSRPVTCSGSMPSFAKRGSKRRPRGCEKEKWDRIAV